MLLARTRRDLLGQALSFVRANQTSQWQRGHARASPASYDRRAILRSLSDSSENEARWRLFFARNAIEPLRLDYETVVASPQAAVDAWPVCWRIEPKRLAP
jgi:LPS sulfotransferase NodH